MRFIFVAACILVTGAMPAYGGDSYVLPDGVSRAPAVALHCVGTGATASPCGTAANPLMATALPAGGVPVSRSIAVAAQQSTTLFAANPARRYLSFQAPQGSYVWVNLVGGPAAPNGVDCAYFGSGTFYESTSYVNRGAITVYSPTAVTISAWEG